MTDGKIKIKYGIFDMDGLMFDTELIFVRSFEEYVSEKTGMVFRRKDLCKLLGCNMTHTRQVFPELFGTEYSCDECYDISRIWVEEYLEKNGLPVKKGLYDLLGFLKDNGVRLAVASGTVTERVERYLKMSGTDKYFDAVVGGDKITRCKPDPESFDLAAASIGCTDPEAAVVFEDSLNGMLAAYNGNYNSVIVPDLIDPTVGNDGKYTVKVQSLDKAIPYFEF